MSEDQYEIIIIGTPIDMQRLVEMADAIFGDMVKAVVDINRKLLALGGGLHADEEAALLEPVPPNRICGASTSIPRSRGLSG